MYNKLIGNINLFNLVAGKLFIGKQGPRLVALIALYLVELIIIIRCLKSFKKTISIYFNEIIMEKPLTLQLKSI